MDKNITMRSTKTEMFAHIGHLEQRLREGGKAMDELRHRISVLEGTRALAATPAAQERIVTIKGVQHRVVLEKSGQCTRKRFVPLTQDEPDYDGPGDYPEFPSGEFPFR